MKSILWFRRDLRINDNALLAHAKDEVLPIFIFDTNILDKLEHNDKRVTFIYKSVLEFKKKLQSIGLDLALFYGDPKKIFTKLKEQNFDEVLLSVDFDSYAKQRDKEVEKILHVRKFQDSFLLDPSLHVKKDGSPYKVFTPFYNALAPLWQSSNIQEYQREMTLKLTPYSYEKIPTLESMRFVRQILPDFLSLDVHTLLEDFIKRIADYKEKRDYFYEDATSKLSVHLRFGLISPKEIFNLTRKYPYSEFFIRELFWREFYNYILYHFPKSEFENFNAYKVQWSHDKDDFKKWCEGRTGFPLIDAAMRHLNETGLMHNRLRMIVASFLCKNLLIDWRWGEAYFAKVLLDYEASSNIGSWQWAASTGADSVPYFRIFNPYLQSKKFDKDALFIKSILSEFKNTNPNLLHVENESQMIDIAYSRDRAIEAFKRARDARD